MRLIHRNAPDGLDMAKKYEAQCQDMRKNLLNWCAEHPNADVKIQWNYPKHVAPFMSFKEGVDTGLISMNAEGLQLVTAMAPGKLHEVTVLMVRAVLESVVRK